MRFLGIAFVAVLLLASGVFLATAPKDAPTAVDNTEGERMAQQFADTYATPPAAQGPVAPEQTAAASATTQNTTPISNIISNQNIMHATLHTNYGDISLEFYKEQTPNTVANFIKLAQSGFYDGTKFHRVIKEFMLQGGDPLSKDDSMQSRWGTGGPGYSFADEIGPNNHNNSGTIAMANSGPNTNGSQFFINVANNNFLDGKHTVFGKITSGMEIVTKIENTKTGQNDRPVEPAVIQKVTVSE